MKMGKLNKLLAGKMDFKDGISISYYVNDLQYLNQHLIDTLDGIKLLV